MGLAVGGKPAKGFAYGWVNVGSRKLRHVQGFEHERIKCQLRPSYIILNSGASFLGVGKPMKLNLGLVMLMLAATLAFAAAPVSASSMSSDDACDSGDICCQTSGLNCSCSTDQDPWNNEVERDCTDTASGFPCQSSTGPVPWFQVGTNCLAPINLPVK